MEGKATFTIVVSSRSIKDATNKTLTASQRNFIIPLTDLIDGSCIPQQQTHF
jgi:hypothetical protein